MYEDDKITNVSLNVAKGFGNTITFSSTQSEMIYQSKNKNTNPKK